MSSVKRGPEEEGKVSASQRLLGQLPPPLHPFSLSLPAMAGGRSCYTQRLSARVLCVNLHFRFSEKSWTFWTHIWPNSSGGVSAEPSNLLHLSVPGEGCSWFVGGSVRDSCKNSKSAWLAAVVLWMWRGSIPGLNGRRSKVIKVKRIFVKNRRCFLLHRSGSNKGSGGQKHSVCLYSYSLKSTQKQFVLIISYFHVFCKFLKPKPLFRFLSMTWF